MLFLSPPVTCNRIVLHGRHNSNNNCVCIYLCASLSLSLSLVAVYVLCDSDVSCCRDERVRRASDGIHATLRRPHNRTIAHVLQSPPSVTRLHLQTRSSQSTHRRTAVVAVAVVAVVVGRRLLPSITGGAREVALDTGGERLPTSCTRRCCTCHAPDHFFRSVCLSAQQISRLDQRCTCAKDRGIDWTCPRVGREH